MQDSAAPTLEGLDTKEPILGGHRGGFPLGEDGNYMDTTVIILSMALHHRGAMVAAVAITCVDQAEAMPVNCIHFDLVFWSHWRR